MPHVIKAYSQGSLFIGNLHESHLELCECDHCGEYLDRYDVAIVYTTLKQDSVFHTFHFPDQTEVQTMVRSLRAEERAEEKHQKALKALNVLKSQGEYIFDGSSYQTLKGKQITVTV